MTELKVKGVDDVYIEYFNTGNHDLAKVYLKTEVDHYIADLEEYHKKEIEQLLMEIVELKAQNKRLEEIKDKYKSCAKKAINKIAKCELKIRSLSRAMYKACANWAHEAKFDYDDEFSLWDKMETKCLKKATGLK